MGINQGNSVMANERVISPYLHTIDVAVCRYNREKMRIEVLLQKREKEPFQGEWALPGVVVNGDCQDQDIDSALVRLLKSSKVGMNPWYIEQVGTVGSAVRDPRGWSSSTFYFAIVGSDNEPGEDKAFFDLAGCSNKIVKLPFDHNLLCGKVSERIASKSLYSNLPMLFLGKEVIFSDALAVTSLILGREVSKGSMGGRMNKMIEEGYLLETGRKVRQAGRPALAVRENPTPDQLYIFEKSFRK